MKSLPFSAQLYIVAVLLVTVLVTGFCIVTLPLNLTCILATLILIPAIFFADCYPIDLAEGVHAEVTVSCTLKMAAAIIFGPQVTVLSSLFGTWLADMRLHRAWYKVAFNTAVMTLTFASMSLAYELLYDGIRMPFNSWRNALAVVCMVAVYFLVNTGQVTAIVSLTTGVRFMHIWKVNFRDSVWNNLTIIPLGAVMAQLWLFRPWSILALVLPMVVVRQSFQYIAELQKQTREALVSMADAIDDRDSSTFEHSQRVAVLAEAIAREHGLPVEDVETVRVVGRLHDLGKIGMSNMLLNKPGKFEESERTEFQRHPDIGANIVKSFRLFHEGQEFIRYHHERYDGKGYPRGLAGTEIPLASRILTVADSLDAMTSKRVYREAFTIEQAIEDLVRNKGKQFDPEVVESCLRVLRAWGGNLPWSERSAAPVPIIGRAWAGQDLLRSKRVAPSEAQR